MVLDESRLHLFGSRSGEHPRVRFHGALAVAYTASGDLALLPPPDIPFLLVKPLPFERTASYSGIPWERDVHFFERPGFKEFAKPASAGTCRPIEETNP
jgi:hypothetical protein